MKFISNSQPKYLFIFINILLYINSLTNAQPSFKKVLAAGYNNAQGKSISPTKSNFILIERGENFIINLLDSNCALINMRDLSSDLSQPQWDRSNNYFNILNDSIIIIIGHQYSANWGIYFCKYNIQDSKINQITYLNNLRSLIVSLNKGLDSTFLISSISYPDSRPVIIQTTNDGILRESFKVDNLYGGAKFCIQNFDYSLLSGINADTVGATIVKSDTSGAVIWAKSYFRPRGSWEAAVQNSNGTITLLAKTDTVAFSQTNTSKLNLLTIDTAGNVLWCKTFGDSLFSFVNYPLAQLKASPNGGYLVAATIRNLTTNTNDLFIMKTDASGDTVWTRMHGNPTSNETGNDISATDDGGYIICGGSDTKQFSNNAGTYIIKADSLGMTSSHCQEFNFPVGINNTTPFDSAINCSISLGWVIPGNSSLIDTTFLHYLPLDGCQLLGTNDVDPEENKKLIMYPNPSTGKFTILFNEQHQGNKKLIVYDVFGNELFQILNVNIFAPKLDLSKQPPGIYFIKVIQGQEVEVVKVVIE